MAEGEMITLTAGFLIAGMRDFCDSNIQGIRYEGEGGLLSLWGQGCLELHIEITRYAPMIAKLADQLFALQIHRSPGIWEYEVTESLGYRIASWIANHEGKTPSPAWVKGQLAELAAEFMTKTNDRDWLPYCHSLL